MADEQSSPDADAEACLGELLRQAHVAIQRGDDERFEEVVEEFFVTAAEDSLSGASPEFRLLELANECEEQADWPGAESAYRQLLAEPELAPITQAKAHAGLSALDYLRQRDADALHHARLATAAARKLDLPIVTAMYLCAEAERWLPSGQTEAAAAVVAEGLLVVEPDSSLQQLRARLLTLRAECALRSGQLVEAEADLDLAFELIEPMARLRMAAGAHCDLARWWAATARIAAARHDHPQAVNAWGEAVRLARGVATLPHTECPYTKFKLAEMLRELADALIAGGREDEAEQAQAEYKTILAVVFGASSG